MLQSQQILAGALSNQQPNCHLLWLLLAAELLWVCMHICSSSALGTPLALAAAAVVGQTML
jgi:hypothetical protein